MLTQPIAGALDVDDHGVVKQPIQQRGCDHWIAKNLSSFGKAAIRGQDHCAALVTGVDQLKEQIAGNGADAEVAISSMISNDGRQRKRIRSRRRPSRSARARLSMISASGEK
jgi:hypothetical protein